MIGSKIKLKQRHESNQHAQAWNNRLGLLGYSHYLAYMHSHNVLVPSFVVFQLSWHVNVISKHLLLSWHCRRGKEVECYIHNQCNTKAWVFHFLVAWGYHGGKLDYLFICFVTYVTCRPSHMLTCKSAFKKKCLLDGRTFQRTSMFLTSSYHVAALGYETKYMNGKSLPKRVMPSFHLNSHKLSELHNFPYYKSIIQVNASVQFKYKRSICVGLFFYNRLYIILSNFQLKCTPILPFRTWVQKSYMTKDLDRGLWPWVDVGSMDEWSGQSHGANHG